MTLYANHPFPLYGVTDWLFEWTSVWTVHINSGIFFCTILVCKESDIVKKKIHNPIKTFAHINIQLKYLNIHEECMVYDFLINIFIK